MPPVIIVLGVLAIAAGLILEHIEKKKESEEPSIVEETDAEKTARLEVEAKANDETDTNGDTDGANNGSHSGDISTTETSPDSESTSINLDS